MKCTADIIKDLETISHIFRTDGPNPAYHYCQTFKNAIKVLKRESGYLAELKDYALEVTQLRVEK